MILKSLFKRYLVLPIQFQLSNYMAKQTIGRFLLNCLDVRHVFNVREDSKVINTSIYLAVGPNLEGRKEVLGL